MKKVIYLIAIATTVVLASCGNATTTTSADNDSTAIAENPADANVSQSENRDAVEAKVRQIYDRINQMAEDGLIDLTQIEQEYCTKYFLDLQKRIAKYDENAVGDMRFMGDEGYHWLLGLVTPYSIENVNVDFLSDTEAQVQLRVSSLGLGKAADDDDESIAGTTMILSLEDGEWKVSNWLDPEAYDEGGYLSMLENYAQENNIPASQP